MLRTGDVVPISSQDAFVAYHSEWSYYSPTSPRMLPPSKSTQSTCISSRSALQRKEPKVVLGESKPLCLRHKQSLWLH